MKIAILNSNLSAGGKPAHLAEVLASSFAGSGHEANVFHLGELDLPACDGFSCYQNETTISLTVALAEAEAMLLISPIYNYDLNSAAKNLIELTGNSWKGKAVGLVVTAGADRSYLSPLAFMNSLSIDYRCLVSPRYVYVTPQDFTPEGTLSPDSPVAGRLAFLAAELPILAEAAGRITSLSPWNQRT